MKKFISLLLVLLLALSLAVACTPPVEEEPPAEEPTEEPAEEPTEEPTEEEPGEEEPGQVTEDVTTASLVADEEGFKNAISENGTWIVAILNDITINEDLVVEGEFRNKDNPDENLYRKLAFYAQDEERNITARYTLTAPKLTIKSPNTSIQGGTFVGDVYVEANGFNLGKDAKIEGNVYFANEEYQGSFNSDEGTVTGDTKVQ